MRELLLIGGTGQVGLAIQQLASQNFCRVAAPHREQLNLFNAQAIRDLIQLRPWAAVINCAAYTAVDRAEDEPEVAWFINSTVPLVMAEACHEAGCPILHVSSDYVFSGQKSCAYEEADAISPINVYGASKVGGELAIRARTDRHAIIRTSWVVSPFRTNFLKKMFEYARRTETVLVVEDQFGSPTSAHSLAKAILAVAVRLSDDPYAPTGTFHWTDEGMTTWADLAEEIFKVSKSLGGPSASVTRIKSADYPTRARRPKNSQLSMGRLPALFSIERVRWQESVAAIVREVVE